METPALSVSTEKSLSADKSRAAIQTSGAVGLSKIVYWIRMFARYLSHRPGRRSCACSPCPKKGTSSKESECCRGTKKDGVIVRQEEPTEWVNSLVVVQKSTGAVRLCIDAGDLNLAIKITPLPHEHY